MLPFANVDEAIPGGKAFIVAPLLGLMIWTLIIFGVTMVILNKLFLPKIRDFLAERERYVEDQEAAASKGRAEAQELLDEYRERLGEARRHADEIVTAARRAGERIYEDAEERAAKHNAELMERTHHRIEAETEQAMAAIRAEVANLTARAAEKVTGKPLDDAESRKVIESAVADLDFSTVGVIRGGA